MAAKKKVAKTPAKKKAATKKKEVAKVAVASKTAPAAKQAAAAKNTAAKKKAPAKKKPPAKKQAVSKTTAKAPTKKKAAAKKDASVTKKAPAAKKKATAKQADKKTAAKKSAVTKPKRNSSPTTKKANINKVSTSAQSAASRAAQQDVQLGPIHGVEPYQPSAGEEYMSDSQLTHFREILLNWKQELMEGVDRTISHLKDEPSNFPDPNDRATQESEFGLELRARDRERKLLRKIDAALARVEDQSYGYCEETGEEIGLRRLEARPIATLCLEAQERHELTERHFGERD